MMLPTPKRAALSQARSCSWLIYGKSVQIRRISYVHLVFCLRDCHIPELRCRTEAVERGPSMTADPVAEI